VRSAVWICWLAACGCTPQEPPSWPQGGTALVIAPARWESDGDVVEIQADGKVLDDGSTVFILDRVGRVVTDDYDPMAILLPDGRVYGTDERALGQVGVTNAAPPWSANAWLMVAPDGAVVHFTPEGERVSLGRWQGCNGPVLRTCTLVTHLLTLRRMQSRSSGVGVGIGVGIGVGF
jgi:hypothetical protein